MKQILIIRISSFGDIIQCLNTLSVLKSEYPHSQIHWVVREDFKKLVEHHPLVDNVWVVEKEKGLRGLLNLINEIKKQPFDLIYDAHNNLRSHIICQKITSTELIRRPKNRWKRFLLFKFHINKFPTPFKAAESFLKPLTENKLLKTDLWGTNPTFIPLEVNEKVRTLLPAKYITIMPSAAWENKRWPLKHWNSLLEKLKDSFNVIILGGPNDHYCFEIKKNFPQKNILNMAGKLSLIESCAAIYNSSLNISNDTGLLHVSDYFCKPTIALIGPTAFGYTYNKNSYNLETQNLKCKPCSKDGRTRCINSDFKKCLFEVTPEKVFQQITKVLDRSL